MEKILLSTNPPTLSVLGCGRLGKAIARMLVDQGHVRIGQVRTRSLAGAAGAVVAIGDGRAIPPDEDFESVDILMIATPDGAIERSAESLAQSHALASHPIAFHCSGALSSELLSPLRLAGAETASLHPIRSFPGTPVVDFAGTHCAVEGTEAAVSWLTTTFEACGGRLFRIAPEAKLLYHASTVIACNYLVALIDAAAQTQSLAGIDRETGLALLRPLIEGTIENVFEHGPAAALTGPIARGEADLVHAQARAVAQADPSLGRLYRLLGLATAELARRGEDLDDAGKRAIEAALELEDSR